MYNVDVNEHPIIGKKKLHMKNEFSGFDGTLSKFNKNMRERGKKNLLA